MSGNPLLRNSIMVILFFIVAAQIWLDALPDGDGFIELFAVMTVEALLIHPLGRPLAGLVVAGAGVLLAVRTWSQFLASPKGIEWSDKWRIRAASRTSLRLETNPDNPGRPLVLATHAWSWRTFRTDAASLGLLVDSAAAEAVKATRNPALWHITTIRTLTQGKDPFGFVPWVLAQPELDRATAAWVLLYFNGTQFLQGETLAPTPHLSGQKLAELLTSVCDRSQKLGFGPDRIGLGPAFDIERRNCLWVLQHGEVTWNLARPKALLESPFTEPELNRAFFVWDQTNAHRNPRPLVLDGAEEELYIDPGDRQALEQLKRIGSPVYWHNAVMAIVAYSKDRHDFVSWVLDQPHTSRATAAWLFLWLEGKRYLTEGAAAFEYPVGQNEPEKVIGWLEKICARSAGPGFVNDEIGLDPDWEKARIKCLEIIGDHHVRAGVNVPLRLLLTPFNDACDSDEIWVEDGLVVALSTDPALKRAFSSVQFKYQPTPRVSAA